MCESQILTVSWGFTRFYLGGALCIELRNDALVIMLGCVDVAFIDTQRDLRSSVRPGLVFEARFSGSVSCRPQIFFSASFIRTQHGEIDRSVLIRRDDKILYW
jgi:hypothetical protein